MIVPTTPIEAPVMRNTRMMAYFVAPMVRRIAMSLRLSFTSMIRPDTILSVATSTISVKIMNMTLRSTCSALKKTELRCRQSIMKMDRPAASVISGRSCADLFRIFGIDLDRGHVTGAIEIGLRFGQRHEHDGRIVFRHADLEYRGDLIAP